MSATHKHLNIAQQVKHNLGRLIVEHQDTINALPTEAELCTEFGVSRSAIREALKMLSGKGLISTKPRQGIKIEPMENWSLFDKDLLDWINSTKAHKSVAFELLELKKAIQPEAVLLAAELATPSTINEIENQLAIMKTNRNSPHIFNAADERFQVILFLSSNNRFYRGLTDFLKTAIKIEQKAITINVDKILKKREKMVNLIKRRNGASAKRLVNNEIEDTIDCLSALSKKNDVEPTIKTNYSTLALTHSQ